jgi:hypothetical protein
VQPGHSYRAEARMFEEPFCAERGHVVVGAMGHWVRLEKEH